jgi:hypothetical protein
LSKIDIEDVNKALGEMHDEVENRVVTTDFSTKLGEQQKINQNLVAENCAARWLWHSGNLSPNGFAVPWEVQSVNTCVENFIWDEERTSIVTVAPGLYELTMGFFNCKKPAV